MVSRFTERDNVRDGARGQSASYAPTTRNQRREPNRFVQGVKNFGNDAGQMASDFSGVLQNNPVTNTIQKGVNYGRDNIMEKFPSLMGAAMTGVKSVSDNMGMSRQNKKYFDGNWLNDKIPDNVIDSLMTQSGKDFYDKYTKLAAVEGDRERKEEYLDRAQSARRNAQITGRLNYALSQIDPDNEYINSAGLPSYSQDLFGEGQGRLDMDAFREAMGMGEGILGGLSEEDRNGEVIDSYSQQTFRPDMADVAGPGSGPIFYDRAEGLDFAEDPDQPYVAPDNYVEDDFGAFYTDENTLAGPNPMPFDDSNREQGIMDQQYQSPIGPTPNPSRRPNMMDVSGRGINRGLFPYPGYNDPVNIEQFGRGEIPYGFDYDQSNKDRVDNYSLDQILGRIIPEEEEMEEEFQMFGPRGR